MVSANPRMFRASRGHILSTLYPMSIRYQTSEERRRAGRRESEPDDELIKAKLQQAQAYNDMAAALRREAKALENQAGCKKREAES